MKVHLWTEDQAPDFVKTDDGGLVFYSHPDLQNYASGDHIHYKTRLGITAFEIISIDRPFLRDYDPKLQSITAKKLD